MGKKKAQRLDERKLRSLSCRARLVDRGKSGQRRTPAFDALEGSVGGNSPRVTVGLAIKPPQPPSALVSETGSGEWNGPNFGMVGAESSVFEEDGAISSTLPDRSRGNTEAHGSGDLETGGRYSEGSGRGIQLFRKQFKLIVIAHQWARAAESSSAGSGSALGDAASTTDRKKKGGNRKKKSGKRKKNDKKNDGLRKGYTAQVNICIWPPRRCA